MTIEPSKAASPSYFWSCITLNDDCPFFSASDQRLNYFGMGLVTMYTAFLLTILADLNFYWTIDTFQDRIDNCINFIKKNLRQVDGDQRRLVSTQERTEKQIKRSKECTRVLTALRAALATDDPTKMQAITGSVDEDGLDAMRSID